MSYYVYINRNRVPRLTNVNCTFDYFNSLYIYIFFAYFSVSISFSLVPEHKSK